MITIDKARLRELAEKAKQGGYVSESELAYALRDPATVLALLDDHEALQAECENLRKDAEMGRVVWKFIDRMNDVCPESDPADKILADFVIAFNAAMQEPNP